MRRILELLYRSFDQDLSPEESDELRRALDGSEELRREKRKIELMRRVLSDSTCDSFGPFFVQRLMARIEASHVTEPGDAFSQALVRTFRWVALAAGLFIGVSMIRNVLITDKVSLTSLIGVPEITVEEVLEPPVETILEELT